MPCRIMSAPGFFFPTVSRRQHARRLRRQTFLADYGMVWVGEDSGDDDDDATDAEDDAETATVSTSTDEPAQQRKAHGSFFTWAPLLLSYLSPTFNAAPPTQPAASTVKAKTPAEPAAVAQDPQGAPGPSSFTPHPDFVPDFDKVRPEHHCTLFQFVPQFHVRPFLALNVLFPRGPGLEQHQ